MKKGVIIAFVALATSLAVYAGVGNNNTTEKANTACCDKSACCPDGPNMPDCCEKSCD